VGGKKRPFREGKKRKKGGEAQQQGGARGVLRPRKEVSFGRGGCTRTKKQGGFLQKKKKKGESGGLVLGSAVLEGEKEGTSQTPILEGGKKKNILSAPRGGI